MCGGQEELELRPYVPGEDEEAILAVDARRHNAWSNRVHRLGRSEMRARAADPSDPLEVVVAERDGQIVGYAAWYPPTGWLGRRD